jgi:hypothetical protein
MNGFRFQEAANNSVRLNVSRFKIALLPLLDSRVSDTHALSLLRVKSSLHEW